MYTIGVTGGIGSGKSTVTTLFQELGIEVVDADRVSREVVQAGTPALNRISQRYGKEILLQDGNLNRTKLREIVFAKPEEKQWLEALLHPEILHICRDRLEHAHSSYAILSSPLLVESGEYQLVDRVLVVDIPEDLQVLRAGRRDKVSDEAIQQIIKNQLSRQERLSYANDVVDNSDDELALRARIEDLHLRYLQYALDQTNEQ